MNILYKHLENTSGLIGVYVDDLIIKASDSFKIQVKNIALSSCETEYIVVTDVTCQGIWLGRLIGELTARK